jgi:cytochrome P450
MISQIPRDGSTVDLQPLIFSLYLDTSTLFLFGESFESLSRGLSGDTKGFVESFAYSLGGGGLRMALGPLKFLHRDRKWHESNAQNHAFIEKYVDAALERKRLGVKNSENEKRPVLLDLMAEHMDDRIQLRNEATQAFVAAHETTACLISNVVFLLARHPDVQARVRDEARSIRDKPLDFDVVVKMKYLQNVINESNFDHFLRSRQC